MPLEELLEKHIKALDRNSAALEAMMAAGAGAKGRTREGSKADPGRDEPARDVRAEREPEKKVEREPEKPKVDDNGELMEQLRAYMDYGDKDDPEDEKERDRRADFVDAMNKFLGVKKAREIDPKHTTKIKRWLRLDKNGDKVDFDKD